MKGNSIWKSKFNSLQNVLAQNKVEFNCLNNSPKRPIFCRMEDKLFERLNVWIKFRTGSDDYYRSLIALPRDLPKKMVD